MSNLTPQIILGGSASNGNGSSPINGYPETIGESYAALISNGANFFQSSGAKVFHLDAGAMSTASTAQIGAVVQGVTITAAIVAENQHLLNAIGTYCRANGITIQVEAQLDNTPTADWTYQWLAPAVEAGLPISSVENDNESDVSSPDVPTNWATLATNEVDIVKQIAAYYPNVQIGQWEGMGSFAATVNQLSAYDMAANAAMLPGISYLVADTSWDAPWVTSAASWQGWLNTLSQIAQTDGLGLNVLLGATNTDTTNEQWTAQSEQHAEMLASTGVPVSALLIRSWNPAYPTNALPINQPTSISNDAVEISATYTLYGAGDITAQGPIRATFAPQLIVAANSPSSFGTSASLTWTASDVVSDAKVAIVIVDETGKLTAQESGSGTVSGSGTNELILNGGSADIGSELKSLLVTETTIGPDTIDVEVFGANGRLSDSQINVLTLPSSSGYGPNTYTFAPTSAGQGWTGSSASVGPNDIVNSETLVWNRANPDPTTGQYQQITTDSIHAPLLEAGVSVIDGVIEEPLADPASGTAGSLPLSMSSWNNSAYDPSSQITLVSVVSTTLGFDAASGELESIVDNLSPTSPVTQTLGIAVDGFLTSGGIQVTQENTGDNPNWLSTWSSKLASVTSTYGSNGQILEQLYQGGVSEPYFTLDNVFDPSTHQLWEQMESVSPPTSSPNFVTGDEYVTEFNTGDNPNWDRVDWGNNGQVTVTFQDYYADNVSTVAPVPTGLQTTDAYGVVSSVLIGPTSGGGTLIASNWITSIIGYGHDNIDAGILTSSISTGEGGSAIDIPAVDGTSLTIGSGGNDVIQVQSATAITVNGNGTGDTLNLNGVGIVAQIGSGDTINLDGRNDVANAGSNTTAWVWGAGDTLVAQGATTAWLVGQNDTLSAGNTATIDMAGLNDVLTAGTNSVVWEYGTGASATLLANGIIDQLGANEIGVGGSATSGWEAGTGDQLTVGANSIVTICGISDSVSVGASSTITVAGTATSDTLNLGGIGDVAQVLNGDTININGTNDVVTAGSQTLGLVVGSNDQLTAGTNSAISVSGSSDTVSIGAFSTITVNGNGTGDTLNLNGVGIVAQVGSGDTINLDGGNDVANAGSNTTAWVWGAGDTLVAQGATTAWLVGQNDTLSAGNTATVDMAGLNDVLTAGTNSVVWEYGTGASATLLANGIIDQLGANEIGVGGSATSGWEAGTGNQLTVGANSIVIICGISDSVSVGASSTITVAGTATSDTLNLGGIGDVAQVLNGDTININGTNDVVTAGSQTLGLVVGSNDQLTAGTNSAISVSGSSDTVSIGAFSTITVNGNGTGDTLNLNGVGIVAQVGSGDTINLDGGNDVANAGSNTTAWVWGAGDTLVAQGATTAWLVGQNDTLSAGNTATVDMAGLNDVLTAGTNSVVWEYGTGASATLLANGIIDQLGANEIGVGGSATSGWEAGTGDQLTVGANSIVTICGISDSVSVGASSTITVAGTATSDTLNLGGIGDVAQVLNGDTININGTNDVVTAGSQTLGLVVGSNDQLTAGTNSAISVSGSSDTVSIGAFSTITVNGNGTGDTLNLNGVGIVAQVGSGDTINLDGGNDVANAGSNTTAWVWGAGDTLVAQGATTAWLVGQNDTLSAGNTATVDMAGLNDVLTAGTNSVVWEYGTGASATLLANGIIDQLGANEIGVGGSATSGWEAGTGNQLTVGANSIVNVVGNQSTATLGNSSVINLLGQYDTAVLSADTAAFIYGTGDVIKLAATGGSQSVTGFNLSANDQIDLTSMLRGVSLTQDMSNLSQYLIITNIGSDSVLSVVNGSVSDSLTLVGCSNLNISTLISHDTLAMPSH